jgi:hypothetical protein
MNYYQLSLFCESGAHLVGKVALHVKQLALNVLADVVARAVLLLHRMSCALHRLPPPPPPLPPFSTPLTSH